MRLDGKVAVITGASRGQGAAEARLFVAEGARVLLCDVRDELGEEVAAALGESATYTHLDVRDPAQWAAAIALALDRFGRLDVLVNNAAIFGDGTIEHQPLDEYLDYVEINEVGPWLGMQTAIPALRAVGGGSIVNISSTSGFFGSPGVSAYTSTKFALRGLTKCAALELAADGIRVNSVHPGPIDTEMVAGRALRMPALGRSGTPGEVANVVLFLASDESSYCTGAEFTVDGGLLAGGVPR